MQSEKEVVSLSVTPSGCPMFQELALRLHALHEALALPLFNKSWRNLASQLDLVKIYFVSLVKNEIKKLSSFFETKVKFFQMAQV